MTRLAGRCGASGRIGTAEAFQEAFGVSRETLDRLKTYEALLKAWQRTINLVSPATLDDVWHRHFADSAQLLELALSEAPSPPPCGGGQGRGEPRRLMSWSPPLLASPTRGVEKCPEG